MGLEKGAQVDLDLISCFSTRLLRLCWWLKAWYHVAGQTSEHMELKKGVLMVQIPSLCAGGCRRVRFSKPYIHTMSQPCATLTLKQSKFDAEGFASTGARLCFRFCALLAKFAIIAYITMVDLITSLC